MSGRIANSILAPELVARACETALRSQRADGSFQPGHNGPYHDPETPVRNTSHWLIIVSHLSKASGAKRLLNAAYGAAEFLASSKARPLGYSYHHRDEPGKDRCNGLIGQAWTIEALAEAGTLLGEPALLELAEKAFLQHPFRHELALWDRIEVDGRNLGPDMTLNHQLWFAAAGAMLGDVGESSIKVPIRRFLDRLPELMVVFPDGFIKHRVVSPYPRASISRAGNPLSVVRQTLGAAKRLILRTPPSGKTQRFTEDERRVGYQSFNLYAFALLKRWLPGHELWHSAELERATSAVLGGAYRDALEKNVFGYGYNVPGFEVPVALTELSTLKGRELLEQCRWWVNEQFRRTMDWSTCTLSRNTQDPQTLTARIYELLRLPKELLESIEIEVPKQ